MLAEISNALSVCMMCASVCQRRCQPHHGTRGVFQENRHNNFDTQGDEINGKLHGFIANSNLVLVFRFQIRKAVYVFVVTDGPPVAVHGTVPGSGPRGTRSTKPDASNSPTTDPSLDDSANFLIENIILRTITNLNSNHSITTPPQNPRNMTNTSKHVQINAFPIILTTSESPTEGSFEFSNNINITRFTAGSVVDGPSSERNVSLSSVRFHNKMMFLAFPAVGNIVVLDIVSVKSVTAQGRLSGARTPLRSSGSCCRTLLPKARIGAGTRLVSDSRRASFP